MHLNSKKETTDHTGCTEVMIHFTWTHQNNKRLQNVMPSLVGNGMGRINKTDAASSHCASTAQVAVGGAIIRGIFVQP